MPSNLVISGGPGHDFAGTTAALVEALDEVGVRSSVFEDPHEAFAALVTPGIAWDLVTVNALWWRMDVDRYAAQRSRWAFQARDDELDALLAHVTTGGGLLACHTAVICFDGDPRWAACTGATWNWERSSHPPLGPTMVEPTEAGRRHPIARGLDAFTTTDEVYGHLDALGDVVPLLTSHHDGVHHPLLWARTVGAGRAVTNLLGHDRGAVAHPAHRTIVQRAACWATDATTTPAASDRSSRP